MRSYSFELAWCLSAALASASPTLASVQHPEIRVGQDIPVGETPEGKMMIEPPLVAHPSDPHRLLAVGLSTEPDYSEEYCLVFLSSDGGGTWSQQRLSGEGCGDPWLTLTEERAVLTALGTHPDLPEDADQLLTFFSPDGGSYWSPVPQSLGRGHDGPRSLAAGEGTVYVTSG